MKHISQGVKVGTLAFALVIGSYAAFKSVGGETSSEESYALWAKFNDASGLPVGSSLVVAGVPVGEIDARSLEGRYARLSFRLRDDIEVWSNAVVYKKAASLMGNQYLEVDPGTRFRVDSAGKRIENQLLRDGDQIERVIEATTAEDLVRRADRISPNVEALVLSVRDLREDARRLVDGPVASATTRIGHAIEEERETVQRIVRRGKRAKASIELIAKEVPALTRNADSKVEAIVERADEVAEEGQELIAVARREVDETSAKAREKLNVFDVGVSHARSIADKIDEGKGTLGQLVNESALAENIEEISEDAKGFVGTLFGMQTYVGLRSEYRIRGGGLRSYVNVEIFTRPDKFYLVELVKAPRGGYPNITLQFDPTTGQYRRRVLIEDEIRFTFQFAKRISWATFRYGIKESTGGVGFDGHWFDDRLQLSLDVSDGSFDRWPRLKVAAAYEVFKHLYILGGIDEALNEPDSLPVIAHPFDVPVLFDEFRFGRDYFLGAQLRFNDQDLSALLFIGGSAVAGIGQ